MIGGLGTTELIIILTIVLIIFGAGRLPEVGSALGKGIRNFRSASKGEDQRDVTPDENDSPASIGQSNKTESVSNKEKENA